MNKRPTLTVLEDQNAQEILSNGIDLLLLNNEFTVASFIQEESKDINWTKPGVAYATVICLLLPYISFNTLREKSSYGVLSNVDSNQNEKI